MIDEKLLISYLKKQKREYNEQVVILQKELISSLMYNHRQEYIIKNLMYESMMNVIRIYENLIEKIENGEFDKAKKNGLSTYTFPPNYARRFAEKSIKPLNKIISSITKEEKYNEDFTNEMQHIKQEQPDELNVSNERYKQVCRQLLEEQRRIEGLKENYYKISADLMCKLRAIDRILNNSYENIDKEYTIIENSGDELAVACARAKLDLITKIVDEVKKI